MKRFMVLVAFGLALMAMLTAEASAQCGQPQRSTSSSDTLSQLLSSGLLSANRGGTQASAFAGTGGSNDAQLAAELRSLRAQVAALNSVTAKPSAVARASSGGGARVFNVPSNGATATATAESNANGVDFATLASLLDQIDASNDVSASATASSNGGGGSCGRGGSGLLARAFSARPFQGRRGSQTTVARSFSRTTSRN